MNDFWVEADDTKFYTFSTPEYKTVADIGGNVSIQMVKKFNKFQKFMWKICFGVEIKDILKESKND